MAGPDNTTRIQTLENKLHNISSRLDVHDVELKAVTGLVEKGGARGDRHHDQITVVEQKILVLDTLTGTRKDIAEIREELVGIKRDVAANTKWQEDEKERQETWQSRFWMILPPVIAAVLSSVLTTAFAYFILNKK